MNRYILLVLVATMAAPASHAATAAKPKHAALTRHRAAATAPPPNCATATQASALTSVGQALYLCPTATGSADVIAVVAGVSLPVSVATTLGTPKLIQFPAGTCGAGTVTAIQHDPTQPTGFQDSGSTASLAVTFLCPVVPKPPVLVSD